METRRDKLLESVKVLKAEWAYLNNIDRLESLSNQYLKLSKLDLKKIKKIQDNKAPDIKIEIINETKEFKGSINWKYKAREVILKNSQDAKKKN